MGNVTEEKWIEMLEKKSDGNYIVKYPKVKSKTGVTFDEHLADSMHIPKGLIAMWSGSIEAIPTGWALCDGQNGTPDLRDRFIVGAGNSYDVGDTGGEERVTLSSSQIPRHRHSSGTLSTSSGGGHSHRGSSASAGSHSHGSGKLSTSSAGSHSHSSGTLSTSTTGSHTHTVELKKDYIGPSTESGPVAKMVNGSTTTSSSGSHNHSISGSTASGGSHSHTISGSTASDGSHSHTITIDSAGSHSHTVSGYTGYVGSGDSHENRPPYYALAFIMKL